MFSTPNRRTASISNDSSRFWQWTHQFQQVRLRPDVKVDRVASVASSSAACARAACSSGGVAVRVNQPHPLQVMLGTRPLAAVVVVGDHMAERCPWPPEIKREALVRNRVEQHPARARSLPRCVSIVLIGSSQCSRK